MGAIGDFLKNLVGKVYGVAKDIIGKIKTGKDVIGKIPVIGSIIRNIPGVSTISNAIDSISGSVDSAAPVVDTIGRGLGMLPFKVANPMRM